MSKKEPLHTLANLYLSAHVANLKSARKTSQVITRDILPHLPEKPAKKIKRADIGKMLLQHHSRPGTRALAFRQSRAMFNWLEDNGLIKKSPMKGMRGPGTVKSRSRHLNDDEIRSVWKALTLHGQGFEALYKVGLLTGQRRGEIAGMISEEIKGQWWTIPAHRTKNGCEHTAFLSEFAQAQLYSATPYLTHPRGLKPLTGSSRAHTRVMAALDGEVDYFVFHDFRRTVKTGMARLGISKEVRDRVLNHRSGIDAIEEVYNRHDYQTEIQKALQAWSDHVQGLVA